MIKGIVSLFTSGAIFHPMVLLGIISGFYSISALKAEEIKALFTGYELYACAGFVALVYTVIFAKIYQEGGENVNWSATLGLALWNFIKYLLSFILSMSFVTLLSF